MMKEQGEIEISVIIPTYKPQKYIEKCLNSIFNQTITVKFEVIIVLNGPYSPYNKKLNILINRKNHKLIEVHFFYIKDACVSSARNYGIDRARGNYITFIDDDDWISPNYLDVLFKIAKPHIVGLSNTIAFDDESKEHDNNFRISKSFLENEIVSINKARKFFNGPWMKLIHRDIIGNRRFDMNFKNGEDSLFMFLISDKIYNCQFTSKDAIYYRRHRIGSAVNVKKPLYNVFANQLKLIVEYCFIFFKQPLQYNLTFFLTRILGAVRGFLNRLF